MSAQIAETAIDLVELRTAASRLLADKVDRRAGWDGKGDQAAALHRAAAEQGWYLLTLPEALGGLDQDFTALAPIYEELGRSAAPLWLAGTMAALDVLQAAGGAEAEATIAAIADGSCRVATVLVPSAAAACQRDMAPIDAGVTHLLLVGMDGSGARLLPADAAGLTLRPAPSWDLGRHYAELAWDGRAAGAELGGSGAALRDAAVAHWNLALAWDCVGAASECLARTVEYMLGRQQFGRAIASFQALKHRAADHKVAIEMARALARHAAEAHAGKSPRSTDLALQARVLATEAFRAVAEDGVQLHGGVGFTWEYDCHLFLKRALVNELLLGTPEHARDQIAAALAIAQG